MAAPIDPVDVPLPLNPAEVLLESCRQIQLELRAQHLTGQIRNFAGESGKRYRDWLKDVLRVGRALEAGQERMRALALQTLSGSAGDFLTRYLNAQPQATWDDIRDALANRFSDAADTQQALNRLRHCKQYKGESVQNFAERILSYGDEAFPGQNINNQLIQVQLRDAFIDGMTDEHVARKLIKNLPHTLEQSLTRATADIQAERAYRVRRQVEEPMEIDLLNCQKNPVEGKLDKMISLLTHATPEGGSAAPNPIETKIDNVLSFLTQPEVNSINQTKETVEQKIDRVLELLTQMAKAQNQPSQHRRFNNTNRGGGPRTELKWTADGSPICMYCQNPGHMRADCRKRKALEANRSGPKGNQQSGN